MVAGGSTMFRHQGTYESAMNMIDHTMNYGNSIVLDIQRQMVDQKLTLDKTSAGQELKRELLEQQKCHEADLRSVREKYNAEVASGRREMATALAEVAKQSEAKIAHAQREMQQIDQSYQDLKREGDAK
jgi:hypothetical protein